MDDDEPGGVRFEPTSVAPKRSPMPTILAIAGLAIAVAVIALEPWGQPSVATTSPSSRAASSSAAASSGTAVSPAPASASPGASPTDSLARIVVPDLLSVIEPHDAWGIRAIVDRWSAGPAGSGRHDYVERWSPMADAPGPDRVATVHEAIDPIVALGVTVPDGVEATDIRVSRPTANGGAEWVAPGPVVDGEDPAGGLLLAPGSTVAAPVPWSPGRYRLDVLTGSGIERIQVGLPGLSGGVPPPADAASPPPDLGPPIALDAHRAGNGAFAIVDGVAAGFDALSGADREAELAWIASSGGPDAADPDRTFVTRAWLRRARALGVMVPAGIAAPVAWARRLAPDPSLSGVLRARGVLRELPDGRRYVLFSPPDGAVVRPGVYAIDASWAPDGSEAAVTWVLVLAPGPEG